MFCLLTNGNKDKINSSNESLEKFFQEAKGIEPSKFLTSIVQRYHTVDAIEEIASLVLILKEKVLYAFIFFFLILLFHQLFSFELIV
jgi:hypothetical protein